MCHTSSQLYVQDVYNTLMKHANFEGGAKKNTCSTLVQNYVQDVLHVYLYHSSIFLTI
jgi:hypothetical protein